MSFGIKSIIEVIVRKSKRQTTSHDSKETGSIWWVFAKWDFNIVGY